MTNSYKLISARAHFLGFVCGRNSLLRVTASNVFALPMVLGLLLSIIGVQTNAQVNSYAYTTATGASLTTLTTPTTLVNSNSDDGVSAVTSIGFNFVFNGTVYTQFSANANGLVRLGATAVTSQWTNSAANANTSTPAIFAYWDDLATGTTGNVRTSLEGTAPNRVRVIQWFVTVPRATAAAANATFQVHLYETTGVVRFVYGSGMVVNTANSGYSVGIATATAVYNNVVTATNLNSTSTFTTTQTNAITSGRSYDFTPPAGPTLTSFTPGSGCPGTSITITGTNMAQIGTTASRVLIGGTPVSSISSNTGTALIAVAGAGTTGNISLVGAGTITTSAGTFTFNTPATPVSSAATSLTTTDFFANWATSAGSTGYFLDVSTSNTFASFVAGYSNLSVGNVTTYQVTGLTPGATYYYRVRGDNGSCSSGNSATITAVLPLCMGTPSAGTGETATPAAITSCSGSAITLALGAGYSTGPGITYQWQQSSAFAGPFTNISGATTATYVTGVLTADSYFRCVVTCTSSTLTATSGVISVLSSFPFPTLVAASPNFCGTGGTTQINASVATNPGYTFTWAMQEGTGFLTSPVSPLNTDNPNFITLNMIGATAGQTGVVRCTADDGAGCIRNSYISVGVYSSGQPSISYAPNDSLCNGGVVTMDANLGPANFSAACITAPGGLASPPPGATTLATGGAAVVTLSAGSLDDGNWNNRPIGFTFNYFGVPYTTVMIGTNGTIIMGSANSTQYNFTGGFPNLANPANCIAASAHDLNLAATGGGFGYGGGTVRHWTEGYAPNRRFVVQYANCATWYSTNVSDGVHSVEVVFYETTGVIDIRAIQVTNPAATTGTFINDTRNKYIGLQDGTRTIGATAPNCSTNAVNYWNGVQDNISTPQAWRFTPPANYTMTWTPAPSIATTTTFDNLTTSATNTGLNRSKATTTALATTTTFTVTAQNLVNNCSTSANTTITILPQPGTLASSGFSIWGANLGVGSATTGSHTACSIQDINLNPATAVSGLNPGETIRYWSAATGGTLLFSGNGTWTRNLGVGSYSVWAEATNGICTSPARTQLTVTITSPPPISISYLGPEFDLVRCDASGFTTIYNEMVDVTPLSYNYTWTEVGSNSFIFNQVTPGFGLLDWHTDTTAVANLDAFNPGTGCAIDTTIQFSIFPIPAVAPTASPDSVCIGGTANLLSGVTAGNFTAACRSVALRTPGAFTDLANAGVSVTPFNVGFSLDDGGWSTVPIGFSFNFFGTNYSNVAVGTNGILQFGSTAGLTDFTFTTPLPTPLEPTNIIAAMATDLDLRTTGRLRYWTEGVSPTRVFVVSYENVPGYSTGLLTAQVMLFETTGVVEIHVAQATAGGSARTAGVNNSTGTVGSAAPRCYLAPGNFWNASTATIPGAFPEAWKFSPPVSYNFTWSSVLPGQISGPTNLNNALAAPTTLVPATVVYGLSITDNVSQCVGPVTPVSVYVVAPPAAPTVAGNGLNSLVDGDGNLTNNEIYFCGDQDVQVFVSDNLDPTDWTAKYYNASVGGTLLFTAAPYNAPYLITNMTASDTIWVAMDNGECEGPRQMVKLIEDVADPITISFISGQAINCGTGTFNAELSASSVASPAYTYTWMPGNIVGTTTGVVSFSNTVNYQVTGDNGYCVTTATQSLSRYDLPNLSITAQFDSVCLGNTSVLTATIPPAPYNVQSIGYSPVPLSSPTFLVQNSVALVPQDIPSLDDGGWFNVPLGFSYNFFGNTYTTCHVSTNGNIQFGNTANFSTSFSPGAIPSTLVPNNYVAGLWTDWNFNNAGGNSIRYETTNIAPNRVFSVQFDGTRFGGATTSAYTTTIELYEATGQVKVHTQQCSDAATATIITGCEDLTGTIGSAAPGRATNFSAAWPAVFSPEGWLFNPPSTYATQWVISNNPGAIVGPTNTAAITAQPAAPSTTYQLIVTDNQTTCTNQFNQQQYQTVSVITSPPVATYSATPFVGTSGGIVTTHTLTPTSPQVGGDVYTWVITPATYTFVNSTNANSYSPQVQFTAAGNYGVSLSISRCGGPAVTVSSPTVFSISAVYCQPVFTDGGDGCSSFGDQVDDVTIKDPANNTIMEHLNTGCGGGTNGYNNYMSPMINGVTTCTMYQGSTYQITIDGAGDTEYYGVWIDVNNDGDFADPGECMGFTPTSALNATFDIGVPSENVIFGTHRMRVMASYSAITATSYCINAIYGEAHEYLVTIAPPVISNDIPTNGINIAFSTNVVYPNCINLSGNTSLATNSPESAGSNGNDVWYRVTAQSTGLSITLNSASMDDYIALYTKDLSGNYNLVPGGIENASSGNGDFERLNIGGLTPGTVYYISVGSASNASAGAFTLCVQHLMKSWCAFTIPVGGFDLCSSYKAIYRGSPAQGVTYNFTFTGTGGGAPVGPSSANGTNGLTTLSNPLFVPNIQYGGIYNAKVDVVYTLNPSAGAPEVITVLGAETDPNCTGVTVKAQPNVEVKLSQRCNASLLRTNYLIGTLVTTMPCGVINYTFEFQQVVGCGDGTLVGGPILVTTAGATPYMPLGVLPNLSNVGAWDVRIRPNFNYGPGSFGPTQRIQVSNTAASVMLPGQETDSIVEKSEETFVAANLYPNPNTGDMVNLNVSGVKSDNVFVRVLDAMGRVVYTNRFAVDGSLNTVVTFAQPLASGIYNVEFTVDGEIMTERMIVTKQ